MAGTVGHESPREVASRAGTLRAALEEEQLAGNFARPGRL
jgi:hypothetical protein